MPTMNVNRPTLLKERDADIDQKLHIYGIANAFQLGKMPSNLQIDTTLNSLLASKALTNPSTRLSDEGRVLVADVRDVVVEAQRLVLTKNEGNLLQEFLWQTTQYGKTASGPSASGGAPTATTATPSAAAVPADPEKPSASTSSPPIIYVTPNANANSSPTYKDDGQKALQGLKTLGQLLITNGQFRKLLKDAATLFRDIAADGAVEASSSLRPSEDQLAGMYDAAPEGTWHDAPQFSKDDWKERTSASQQQKYKAYAKDQAAVYRDKTKSYLDNKVPQERRDEVINRLKKMILECQSHPDYQTAITTLLDLADTYHGHAKTAGTSGLLSAQKHRTGLASAEAQLKLLIERFANGTSTDGLWSSLQTLHQQADQDPRLRQWFVDADGYLRKLLLEQGYVLDEASTAEGKRLHKEARDLLGGTYKTQAMQVVDEVKFLGQQFDADPQNKAFGQAVQKLFQDLGNDEDGKPVFKRHLVRDITSVIVPAAIQSLAYVPLPRIEYSDDQVDAIVENVVVECDNLFPNLLEVVNHNHMTWRRKLAHQGSLPGNNHNVQVTVGGIQADMRNVSYYVKRKQGFPSLTDLGVVSILLHGQGFGFKLGLTSVDTDASSKESSKSSSKVLENKNHFFQVDSVRVDLDSLKIKVHKSRHKALLGLVKPLVLRLLRPVLEKVLAKTIRDQVDQLDAKLYQVQREVRRDQLAARQQGVSAAAGEKQPNTYQRYLTVAKKQFAADKEKSKQDKEAKARANKARGVPEPKVNFAVVHEDSIFPNINLPGGFAAKASSYKQLAKQGDTWQSPVFALGNAAPSRNMPAPPQVTRKVLVREDGTYGGGGGGGGEVNGVNGSNTNVNGSNTNVNGSNTNVNGNNTTTPIHGNPLSAFTTGIDQASNAVTGAVNTVTGTLSSAMGR